MKKLIRREKSTSTKGHYITNAELLSAVLEAKKLGRVTDKLARMLLLIAERYSRKSWFSGYSYREDMVAAAVANLCCNALKFDPETSSNPFAYFTTAIHRSFQNYKSDEKRHRNIRDALLLDASANPSFNFLLDQEQGSGHDDPGEGEPRAESHGEKEEQEQEKGREVEAPMKVGVRARGRRQGKSIAARPTVHAEAKRPSEVKVWKPGTFTVNTDGSLNFIDEAQQRIKRGKNGELIITAAPRRPGGRQGGARQSGPTQVGQPDGLPRQGDHA